NTLNIQVDNTGLANGAQAQAIQFTDATACDENEIVVVASNIPGASAAIDLSASLAKNNRIGGNVTNCFFPVKLNTSTPQVNFLQGLVGWQPTATLVTPAFPATTVDVVN